MLDSGLKRTRSVPLTLHFFAVGAGSWCSSLATRHLSLAASLVAATGRAGIHLLFLAILFGTLACGAGHAQVPAFAGKPAVSRGKGEQTAVLAGGCFWGVDAVFKHVRGVTSVVSGYSGGSAAAAQYEVVSTGTTGHAESVKITFDPSQVSYSDLLRVFFSVAHDPTELNRQGPDEGTQYRSAIFFANEDQKRIALAYIDQLNQAKVFPAPIVTQVVALKDFYPAEAYHQNFLARHPHDPYIVSNDLPKLRELQKQFPALYQPERLDRKSGD